MYGSQFPGQDHLSGNESGQHHLPYLGHATVDSGSRPAGVDQSASKALICCDTLTLPFGGRPALGSGPTALPIAARVMQGVREAGMDGGTGYGGMEVNGQKEGEC